MSTEGNKTSEILDFLKEVRILAGTTLWKGFLTPSFGNSYLNTQPSYCCKVLTIFALIKNQIAPFKNNSKR